MIRQSLMAIGAHADDLESCIGGTLIKYHRIGYEIIYVMSTNNFSGNWSTVRPDGSIHHRPCPHQEIEPQRKKEAALCANLLGATPIHLDHPQRHYFRADGTQAEVRFGCPLPAGLPADVPTILTAYEHRPSVTKLADLILERNPEAVITHSPVMVNIEHFATTLLVLNAFNQAVKSGYQGMLLFWHDISIGPYGQAYTRWDTFVDVSDVWDDKFRAMALNACQIPRVTDMQLPPWGPTCGVRYAEVFDIVSTGVRPPQGTPFNMEILAHRR